MKARTLIPDAPKPVGLEQNKADAPQYRMAPPKPGETAPMMQQAIPSMANFQARMTYLYSDHVVLNKTNQD